jgi:UDP-2,3-diacylglucosamine pyrophosphatase LpxH
MLIVISDLHLTDGSTATNPHETAFELLCSELNVKAHNKQATEIRVVLLGDIVDLVRTDFWHRNNIPAHDRPWGGAALDPRTGMNSDTATVETQFRAVLQDILRQPSCRGLMRALGSLRDGSGKPAAVTYVIGNHDRVFHNFERLKQDFAQAFAPLQVEFTREVSAPAYGVFGRHGHEWDVNCHGWKFLTKVLDQKSKVGQFDPAAYDVMAIGEVITAELMAGLVYYVKAALPTPADHRFHDVIMEVNNVRPMTHVINWITWLLEQQSPKYLNASLDALRQAIGDTLKTTFAKRWDAIKRDYIVSGDLTDHLSKIHGILDDHDRLEKLQKLIAVFEKVEGALDLVGARGSDDYHKGAASEFKSDRLPAGTQYVLYGHTHSAKQQIISAQRSGDVQMYINTGTFLPLIERTDDRHSFAQTHRMSYVCFYNAYEDQNGRLGDGPTVDVWDGIKRKFYTPPPAPMLADAGPVPIPVIV